MAPCIYGLSSAGGSVGYVARVAQCKVCTRAEGERSVASKAHQLGAFVGPIRTLLCDNLYYACDYILPLVFARKVPLSAGVFKCDDFSLFPCDNAAGIDVGCDNSQSSLDDNLCVVTTYCCGLIAGGYRAGYSVDDTWRDIDRCGLRRFATYYLR